MRKYHSDNRNYNAILDAMATIRHNQLNESYMYEGEQEDEEMMEAESDEEEEQMAAVAEMMDEALMELDEEDDEDNLTEADDDRRSRRRARLRNAFLAGAGAAAIAGGVGAAGMGMLPGQFGQQAVQGALGRAGQFAKNIPANLDNLAFRYKTRNAPSTRRPMGGKGPQAQSNAMPDEFNMPKPKTYYSGPKDYI